MQQAKAAKTALALVDAATRSNALLCMADALQAAEADILAANEQDLAAASGTIAPVMLDRLRLTPQRIAGMAQGVRDVAALPDPLGKLQSETTHKNGMNIQRVSVPMGVIAIIYESRPNVTSDAAALAIKAGSACVLRGGKEAFCSNNAITKALQTGLQNAGLPAETVVLVQDTSRASATELMKANGLVDLLIPRGGAGLIRSCVENATVPIIETGTGICHVYVDAAADVTMAVSIMTNAKTSRPSVCNSAEVCLVHQAVAEEFLCRLQGHLVIERKLKNLPPVELRLDETAQSIIPGTLASEADFGTEFLDYILAVRVVQNIDQAIAHIAQHSTGHSETIVTADDTAAARFFAGVDSAAVYHNASTRFTDGGEFGLGCEMGISTQKLHARGPMGLEQLVSYKYLIRGNGQIR